VGSEPNEFGPDKVHRSRRRWFRLAPGHGLIGRLSEAAAAIYSKRLDNRTLRDLGCRFHRNETANLPDSESRNPALADYLTVSSRSKSKGVFVE